MNQVSIDHGLTGSVSLWEWTETEDGEPQYLISFSKARSQVTIDQVSELLEALICAELNEPVKVKLGFITVVLIKFAQGTNIIAQVKPEADELYTVSLNLDQSERLIKHLFLLKITMTHQNQSISC